jgi:hypothetical protein
MDVRSALKGQYRSALAMLRDAIERCPDELWVSGEHPRNVWRIAYHALFFAHFYMMPSDADFVPWAQHREQANFLEELPWPPHGMPEVADPYTQAELAAYARELDAMVDAGIDRLDLDAETCGFWWYKMPKLDHVILSIRHVQDHAGQLAELVRPTAGDVEWVGTVQGDARS